MLRVCNLLQVTQPSRGKQQTAAALTPNGSTLKHRRPVAPAMQLAKPVNIVLPHLKDKPTTSDRVQLQLGATDGMVAVKMSEEHIVEMLQRCTHQGREQTVVRGCCRWPVGL